ncbi:MAG: hypothetical protein HW406_78 [Candidatus Brocadiaceae bacterium]|nr:hypothetical protein [Candidatus Brocadiaceae bacterium]
MCLPDNWGFVPHCGMNELVPGHGALVPTYEYKQRVKLRNL